MLSVREALYRGLAELSVAMEVGAWDDSLSWACRAEEDGDVPLQEGVVAAQRGLALPAPVRDAHHGRLVPGVGRLQAPGAPPVSSHPLPFSKIMQQSLQLADTEGQ